MHGESESHGIHWSPESLTIWTTSHNETYILITWVLKLMWAFTGDYARFFFSYTVVSSGSCVWPQSLDNWEVPAWHSSHTVFTHFLFAVLLFLSGSNRHQFPVVNNTVRYLHLYDFRECYAMHIRTLEWVLETLEVIVGIRGLRHIWQHRSLRLYLHSLSNSR